ncbi:hypothetical protein [Roseovarius rhodophyticola]|uniref:Intracellular septation protein A n=1 Tax=Roseovarius rhodophyticola TaxID=3080827 RepID=A0ABZ2TFR4_9RHOB|nr:hypothetical protein [Roseovarius sp. W115]MDV2928745.1 hypothetical protein [Roseovarius sp. W115]
MKRRWSSKVVDAVSSVPPMRVEYLVPIVVMLMLWVGLSSFGLAKEKSFVMVLVMGQTYAIWRNLPTAAAQLSQPDRDRSRMLYWPVGAMLMLAISQLIISSPIFSQRILSAACIFVLVVMILGMRREDEVLERVSPNSVVRGKLMARVSLLRVNALAAGTVLIVNELLIQSGSLTVWMTGMALFAMILHALYWFMVLMVMPPEDNPV